MGVCKILPCLLPQSDILDARRRRSKEYQERSQMRELRPYQMLELWNRIIVIHCIAMSREVDRPTACAEAAFVGVSTDMIS